MQALPNYTEKKGLIENASKMIYLSISIFFGHSPLAPTVC